MASSGMSREEAERIATPLLAKYRRQFENGEPVALIQAVRLALMWELPVPDWAADVAEAAIIHFFQSNAGASGNGKTGGLKTQHERARMHRRRYQAVAREMAHGCSQAEACRRASQQLKGKYWGQPRSIKDSYEKVRASLGDV